MKFTMIHIVVVCLISISSCKQEERYEHSSKIDFDDFGSPILIQGEELEFDEPLMYPNRVYIIDSVIAFTDSRSEFLLHKYNLNTEKKINECFTFGSGPDEFLSLYTIQALDSNLWIADMQKGSISKYNKAEVLLSDSSKAKSMQNISFGEMFSNVVRLPDNRFVTTISNVKHKRLTFYDSGGEFIETKNDYPTYGRSFTLFEMIEGYCCEMALSPQKDYICLFHKQTDLIEVYDLNGNIKKRIHGPDHFFPHTIERSTDNLVHISPISGKSRDGYFCPVIANNNIYVLYSGAYYDSETPGYLMKHLCVFDNSGAPVKMYVLDKPIFRFAIDPNTNMLYGLSDNPEFHAIKYQL